MENLTIEQCEYYLHNLQLQLEALMTQGGAAEAIHGTIVRIETLQEHRQRLIAAAAAAVPTTPTVPTESTVPAVEPATTPVPLTIPSPGTDNPLPASPSPSGTPGSPTMMAVTAVDRLMVALQQMRDDFEQMVADSRNATDGASATNGTNGTNGTNATNITSDAGNINITSDAGNINITTSIGTINITGILHGEQENGPDYNPMSIIFNIARLLQEMNNSFPSSTMESVNVPLPAELLEKIPIKLSNDPSLLAALNTNCPICQMDVSATAEGEAAEIVETRILPCHHLYHRECIDQWFAQNVRCPLCKQDQRDLLGEP